MKKFRLITTVLFLLVSTVSQTQVLKLGAKAGLNYANFSGSDLQTDAITSYHAGLSAQFKLGDKFSLQPEIIYSTQGASYANLNQELTQKLGYMSIPVLARIHVAKIVSLDFGPQFSYLLSKDIDFDTDVNEFDFAAAGGLTFNVTENLFVQGRYVLGLTEISKNANVKNSVGQLSVGFTF
ncbi:PorT family protein [Flavobacterium amnicola]|uniref:PorT family protein n=1 Tax=Flavobacterium amnicola TaxID=2506422 RepID=A0A4Q1K4B9_9FLAO|nr:porin family protein [Flavobacterium amnicola]RXR20407.1 PorT family protein [Flavobacterium amnicola]